MGKPNYLSEKIERKYLSNMRKNKLLRVKNRLFKLKIYFIEIKDSKLTDRQVILKQEIAESFFKPITETIGDIDKFEQKELEKERHIINNLHD